MESFDPNRPHNVQRPVITSRLMTEVPVRGTPVAPNAKPRRSRRVLKTLLIIIFAGIAILGGFVFVRASNLTNKIFVGKSNNIFRTVADLISSKTGGIKLTGEADGQVNVLLLGIGGPGHDGPYLSDTIIVAQVRPKDGKATLTSIPRDYLINSKEIGQRKINAVFAEKYDQTKSYNEAGKATINVVEGISGLKIPYFAVIDFKGFEKTIDRLGGVDVEVERTFTDYTFPDNSNGYLPAVTFTKGPEHMDGTRALIFARSRHAAGPEGSDFARSQRQQKIVTAAKTKVVDLNLVTDAGTINDLASVVGDHFHTNLSPGEMFHLYDIVKGFSDEATASLSLDPSTGLICSQILESNGAFVLSVCPGKTATDVKSFFKNSFGVGKLTAEKSVVWLADSTVSQTLYKKAEQQLVAAGMTVYKVVYSGKPLTQNVVYSVNDKPATLEFIQSSLTASPVSLPPPGIKIDKAKVDIVVILGTEVETK
jgi:polyisoprenyl-teichoic acid--peptidoglycan teichoic acid transferase